MDLRLVRPRKLAIFEGVPDLVDLRDFDRIIAGREGAAADGENL